MCLNRNASSPGNVPLSGRTSSFRTSPINCARIAVERHDSRAVEHGALDRAAGERRPLGRGELVESRGEQRADRRRHLHVCRPGDSRTIAAISSTNSGFPSADAGSSRAEPDRDRRRDRPAAPRTRLRPSGSTSTVVACSLPPAQPVARVQELGPGHAEQQDRRSAAPVGDVLDEVEERRLGPVQVVAHDDERPLARPLPRAACGPRTRSLRRSPAQPLAEQDAQWPRSRWAQLALVGPQLLHDLDDGPVGDPLAVGEAAAAHDRRVDVARGTRPTSRDLPTPATPSIVNRWHAWSATARSKASPEQPQLALAADERRRRAAALRLAARQRQQAVRLDRLRLALQLQRLDGFDLDRVAHELHASARRAGPRPAAAACSSRAATLTASPVASRSAVPVTTSPVLTPIRACTPSSGQRVAHLQRAARTARSASSSCSDRHAEHRHHRVADELLDRAAVRLDDRASSARSSGRAAPRTASGSVDSPSAVEPVTSQKTTVTVLRTSSGGSAAMSAAPHSRQNFARSGFSAAQLAHLMR